MAHLATDPDLSDACIEGLRKTGRFRAPGWQLANHSAGKVHHTLLTNAHSKVELRRTPKDDQLGALDALQDPGESSKAISNYDSLPGSVNSGSLEVGDATVEEVPDLVGLYRRAYTGNAQSGFPSSMTSVDRATVEAWLHTRSVFVAFRGATLVGAVHVFRRPDWDVPELGRLAVEPAHQGQGIGTRLLAFGEDHARSEGWTRLRLRTLSGHPFLEDWYGRHGYERVDIEPLENRPYDAPILEKEL